MWCAILLLFPALMSLRVYPFFALYLSSLIATTSYPYHLKRSGLPYQVIRIRSLLNAVKKAYGCFSNASALLSKIQAPPGSLSRCFLRFPAPGVVGGLVGLWLVGPMVYGLWPMVGLSLYQELQLIDPSRAIVEHSWVQPELSLSGQS